MIAVFLAEISYKSQLVAIVLRASSRSPRMVPSGSISALILAIFLGVLSAGGVAQILPTKVLKTLAAIGFILMALKFLRSGFKSNQV